MRIQLLVMCVVVSGCTFDIATCKTDLDCVAGGRCGEGGFCVAAAEVGGGSGGGTTVTGGGNGTGGGTSTGGGGGSDNSCDAGCQSGYLCENTVCGLKVTGLNITAPAAGTVFGPQESMVVRATLTTSASVALPQTVSLTAPAFANAPVVMSLVNGEYVADAGFPTGNSGAAVVDVTVAFEDAGFSDSRQVVVDKTPPVVQLIVVPPPERITDGGFTQVDSQMPNAYKRDESAEIRLVSSKPVNYSPGDFSIADAGFPVAEISCAAPCTPDGGSCECFSVDLSVLPMSAYRMTYLPSVPAKSDAHGNLSNVPSPGSLEVTRFGWRRDIRTASATPIAIQTPAISASGVLYVGVQQDAQSGKLWALNPDGSEVVGFDGGSVAVTSHAIANHSLFWSSKDASSGALNALALSGQGVTKLGQCFDTSRTFNSSMVLANFDAGEERLVGMSADGTLASLRPSSSECTVYALGGSAARLSIVALPDEWSIATLGWTGDAFVANDANATLQRISWGTAVSPGWRAASVTSTSQHSLFSRGLAITGSTLAGGGGGGLDVGGVYSYPTNFTAGASASKFVLGTASDGGFADATGPAIDTGGTVVYGNGPLLVEVEQTGSSFTYLGAHNLGAGSLVGVPSIGHDGARYVVSTDGRVFAVDSMTGVLWSAALTSGNPVDFIATSVALDAARGSSGAIGCGPGRLYVAAKGDGSLYSLIVDSKGLSRNAPWPTFQHDGARTGNPNRLITDWSCP